MECQAQQMQPLKLLQDGRILTAGEVGTRLS
jgi:hypothetical protein